MFKRCEMGAEMTEVQSFRRNVGVGSPQQVEELMKAAGLSKWSETYYVLSSLSINPVFPLYQTALW